MAGGVPKINTCGIVMKTHRFSHFHAKHLAGTETILQIPNYPESGA
jgi:hypothetical protein